MGAHRVILGVVITVSLFAAAAGGALWWRHDTGPPAYRFVVAPGDDARQVHLDFPDARMVEIDRTGRLTVETRTRDTRLARPRAYQSVDGVRRAIDVRFEIDPLGVVRFVVGAYDRSRPLVLEGDR